MFGTDSANGGNGVLTVVDRVGVEDDTAAKMPPPPPPRRIGDCRAGYTEGASRRFCAVDDEEEAAAAAAAARVDTGVRTGVGVLDNVEEDNENDEEDNVVAVSPLRRRRRVVAGVKVPFVRTVLFLPSAFGTTGLLGFNS